MKKNKDIALLNRNWIMLLCSFALILIGCSLKVYDMSANFYWISSGLILFSVFWLIIVAEILQSNTIHNKTTWVLAMILFPSITPIYYLITYYKRTYNYSKSYQKKESVQ